MGKMFFSVFGQTQKHVFLGVLGPASVFFRGGRWPARGRPAPDPCRLPPLRRRVIDVFVANIMWRIISRTRIHLVESEIDLLRVYTLHTVLVTVIQCAQ